jgi:hypothetical protein
MAASRKVAAQIAALTRWAHERNPATALHPAREGFLAKLEREVDPNGEMRPEERRAGAERLRAAHMKRIAVKSAEARKLKRAGAA